MIYGGCGFRISCDLMFWAPGEGVVRSLSQCLIFMGLIDIEFHPGNESVISEVHILANEPQICAFKFMSRYKILVDVSRI